MQCMIFFQHILTDFIPAWHGLRSARAAFNYIFTPFKRHESRPMYHTEPRQNMTRKRKSDSLQEYLAIQDFITPISPYYFTTKYTTPKSTKSI